MDNRHRGDRRVVEAVNPDQMRASLAVCRDNIVSSLKGCHVIIDGKKLRGENSTSKGCNGLYILNAMVSDYEICVAEERVDDKTNELTVLPSVIASLCIVGALVSVDAMDTHRNIAQQIIMQDGHYLMALKDNQPTLKDLIEDGSKYIDRMIDKVCGIKKIRKPAGVERNRIRTIYLNVIKRKHKGARLIKDALTRMLPLLYRDILTLLNFIGVDDETYGRFNCTQKRTIQAVIDMYHQQEEMLRLGTHTCDNRIVSIHQPHVCPIVRGKTRSKVEFGAKIGISIVSGYSFIDYHSWEAYNEASDLTTHIEKYKERFGIEPERFFGDKIYLNRENRKILKDKGIQIMGRPLGRPPKNPTDEQLERERIGVSLRDEAEAQFGTGKRAYRANNIRARLPETAQCWTGMCYFVKNLAKFMRELCLVLIEI